MPVVIIGGGITGLSAAWALAKTNKEVTLIEPGPFGGLLRTERVTHGASHCIVECGADSWIRSKPWLRELAGELGLQQQVIACNEALRGTFVYRNGTLVPLPRGLRLVTPTEWRPLLNTSLLGWRTKLHMLRETLRRPTRLPDRSVSDFVRDHFGDEAVEYLAQPLFAGVYGGSPETLGAEGVLPKLVEYEQKFGSVIRGARQEPAVTGPLFESMRAGLSQIPEALVAQLRNRVRFIRTPAMGIEPGRVQVDGEWLHASRIVVACGAPAAARLLAGSEAGQLLAMIQHSSATIFAFGFQPGQAGIIPRGFGFLVPRKERRIILGATWVTNKFPHRAPPGMVVVRCFATGDHSEAAVPDVLADLKRISGINGGLNSASNVDPAFARVYRWPDSLPQYAVGHRQLINRITGVLPATMELAGAFLNGVGMPDCVRSGTHAAALD